MSAARNVVGGVLAGIWLVVSGCPDGGGATPATGDAAGHDAVTGDGGDVATSPDATDVVQPDGADAAAPLDGADVPTPPDVADVPTPPDAADVPAPLDGSDVTAPDGSDVTAPDGSDVTAPDASDVAAPDGSDVTAPDADVDAGPEDVPPDAEPTPGAVVINEVAPDGDAPAGDWVEILNVGAEMVDLAGWSLTNEAGATLAIPATTVLAPGMYLVYYAEEGGLSFDGGGSVTLLGPGGVTVDGTAWAGADAPPGSSWGRIPNATGPFMKLATPTPGAANVANPTAVCGDGLCHLDETCETCAADCPHCPPTEAGQVIVTEIMKDASPAVGDDKGEWVELHNPTATSYELKGVTLRDDDTDVITLTPFSGTLLIEPGDYVLLGRSADLGGGLSPDYVYGDGFQLANSADEVVLEVDGVVIDAVAYDNGETFPDTEGMSLSLDPGSYDAVANDDGANWCAGTLPYLPTDLGTPKAANPPCGPAMNLAVAVNEVMADPADGGGDWIELYNGHDTMDADLGGWSIANQVDATHEIPAGTSLAPGGFLLLDQATLGFGFAADGAAQLVTPYGYVLDAADWADGDAPVGSSWGRLPDGSGPFKTLGAPTPGAPNQEASFECGDGVCNAGETCSSCMTDCGGACSLECPPTLFFSEYVEGASNNKAVELYNNTGAVQDLAAYEVWRISNGGDWATASSYLLSGTLAHGATFVVCHASAAAPVLAACDLAITSGPVAVNGNDALALVRDGVIVDVIGDEGPDPGAAGWEVAGVAGATKDHTLRRNPDVQLGTSDWAMAAATEWTVLDKDTFDGLGGHEITSACGGGIPAYCGDDACNGSETCDTCELDCGPCVGCGDGLCGEGESCATCVPDCGLCAAGPCCVPALTGGCADDAAIETCVCALDGWCCSTEWDDVCVEESVDECGNVCESVCGDDVCSLDETCEGCEADCGPCPTGVCCVPSATPGCAEDAALESCVCAFDGFCCTAAWDDLCVEAAIGGCGHACFETACGDGACDPGESCVSCEVDCGACPSATCVGACGVYDPDAPCQCDELCFGSGDCCDDICDLCAGDFPDACAAPVCGDGVCNGEEYCAACPADCGPCCMGCSASLFFSEYVEGLTTTKALELYNNTGAEVDLAAYAIWRISDGGDWTEGLTNAFALTGALAHGETYVICHAASAADVLAVCDLAVTDGPVLFDGDDALGLVEGDLLVDAIGEEGPDVGDGWTVAGVAAATRDHTLIRKPQVAGCATDWATAASTDWSVEPGDTFGGLGAHTINTICVPGG